VQEGELTRFRCRVGHAYSADSLLAEQSSGLETALWTAFRALEAGEPQHPSAASPPLGVPRVPGREADSGGGRSPGRRRRGNGRSLVTGLVTVRCLPRWDLQENPPRS
jgi:hypothetical protein